MLIALLEKQNASQLPIFFFLSPLIFRNNGEFGAKKYFTDHRTADTIQLFVTKKDIFLVYSFSEYVAAKGIP